ncbi:MAG: paraquat-inducible protein A [Mangrovicoccus sp.]
MLFTSHANAVVTVISLAIAALTLLGIGMTFPFLGLKAAGLSNTASVVDAVLAFSDGMMAPLSLAVAVMILVLPALRLVILIYVLTPLALGRPAFPAAARLFRLNATLRPWAMAEIFMVGVAVALIKVADLADVVLGPAFWTFGIAVLLIGVKEALICERTIWRMIRPA